MSSGVPPSLFEYPIESHQRRHGPAGYADYKSFKPWLRDEFKFRCVFCLHRETWWPDGDAAFSVEHIVPQSKDETLICEYHNLLFACLGCNSAKRDVKLGLDPCQAAYGKHVSCGADGVLIGLTQEGSELIQLCLLNRPKLILSRKKLLGLFKNLTAQSDPNSRELMRAFFGYPENLPDLSQLTPPGGNGKPDGIKASHHNLRSLGKLDNVY